MKREKHAFIQIVESNQGIIKSLCNAYYMDNEDRKDVFQDIILQLWKSFESFRGDSSLGTWIYSVSLHTILAKVRKEKKRIIVESISQSDIKFARAMADDDKELLTIVLRSLKELDKAIVILYLEGYKNKEIAQMLDITSTNVSTRLNRVKAELKAKFKNEHYELRRP